MSKTVVLIVEDEADIRDLLSFNLEREGFATLEAEDGHKGIELAKQHKPDIILLDVMMPGKDGFQVCRELERKSETANIPIIMLTAKGEEIDRIVGLELGADDYVVKPFSVRELILRIRAILRRKEQALQAPSLSKHGISIDPAAHIVTINNNSIDLTATEFRLLEDIMRHAGTVRTREQLLNTVWGYQFEGYARTVDTHVRRLRAKLGTHADNLETVRGVGYRFKA